MRGEGVRGAGRGVRGERWLQTRAFSPTDAAAARLILTTLATLATLATLTTAARLERLTRVSSQTAPLGVFAQG